MAYFRVNVDRLNEESSNIFRYSNLLKNYSDELNGIDFSCFSDKTKTQIEKSVHVLSSNIYTNGKQMHRMSNDLNRIANLYRKTENDLLGNNQNSALAGRIVKDTDDSNDDDDDFDLDYLNIPDWLKKQLEPFKELIKKLLKLIGPIETVDNVFIDDENYGGNQEFMDKLSSERLRELWEFAQDFFPDCGCPFSDQDQFFSYLKEHGCGYVAVANIVFQHYNGREAQFEKDFGYPMYDTDGNLNYDQLIVQLYAQYPDAINSNLPPDYQEEVIEDILGSHGFDVDVDVHYEGLIKEQISYELHNGNQVTVTIPIGTELYTQDANGNYIFDSYLPPHTMEVTGVTKEGYLIVSSWGKKYYIDPNQFNDNPDVNYWYEVVKH